MSLARQIRFGLGKLFARHGADDDAADEVRQYFDDAVAAWKERGLSDDEARRAARCELGNPVAVGEQVRTYGWENAVRTFVSDLRFAARQLRHNAGFTVVSVLTLALGIGASTAIFSAVNPILFEPLPYPDASRILTIWDSYHGARSELAFGTYRELAQRSHTFESMAIFEPWQPALTGAAHAERLEGQSVSAGFFSVLGIAPVVAAIFNPRKTSITDPGS